MSRKKKTAPRYVLFRWISIAIPVFVLLIAVGSIAPRVFNQDEPCANSISCIKDLAGTFEPNRTTAVFMEKNIPIPDTITKTEQIKPVLGDSTAEKHIYVDLSRQRLFAFENNKLMFDFPVSTGKWETTPTGNFNIWVKLRYTQMSGGNPAIGTYYNLPNVPYVMFFYNKEVPKDKGFSLHGTYWHNNFGHPMSYGCVNMKIEEVEKLYNWTNPQTNGTLTYATNVDPGTEVTIYGETPTK